MTETIIAYCGLLCNECPIFIATKKNDEKARVELAKMYSNDRCVFEPEDIHCLGCFQVDVKRSKMCSACEIRACGVGKGLKDCGYCEQFPCSIYNQYIPVDSPERVRLLHRKEQN